MYLTGDNARCDDDGYYWLIEARIPTAARERWEPEFARMIEGFRRLGTGD